MSAWTTAKLTGSQGVGPVVAHGPNLLTDLLTKPDDTHGYHSGRDATAGQEGPGQEALKRTGRHQAYPRNRAHNPKVAGSNPAPATKSLKPGPLGRVLLLASDLNPRSWFNDVSSTECSSY